MKAEEKDRLELLLNSLLDIFDENNLSAEDGALLSANLLATSLTHLDPRKVNEIFLNILDSAMITNNYRPENSPYSVIGSDRGWGLDSALVKEEH